MQNVILAFHDPFNCRYRIGNVATISAEVEWRAVYSSQLLFLL